MKDEDKESMVKLLNINSAHHGLLRRFIAIGKVGAAIDQVIQDITRNEADRGRLWQVYDKLVALQQEREITDECE